ncbi:MAG: substrate-binding periplasmic protein [Pseudomonadota bacterium]
MPEPTTATDGGSRPVITIGADPWCPHNCAVGSDPEGYMLDIAREVFEAQGYQVEYLNVSWARALQMARAGLLDAVAGAFRTDAPDFVFPTEPQGKSQIAMYTAADSDWRYHGLESLNDQTLLAINGYSYSAELDRYIASHADEPTRVWMLSGPSPLNRAINLLEQHRADVFPEDVYVMTWAQRADTDSRPLRQGGRLRQTDTFIAFSPENAESAKLADLLSRGTLQLRENGRMREILAAYGLSED